MALNRSRDDQLYLHMATICERALREADGVLSAIRIVDQFIFRFDPSSIEKPFAIPLRFYVVLVLKTLDFEGQVTGRFVLHGVDGAQIDDWPFETDIPAGARPRGVNLVGEIGFLVRSEGLYSIEVHLQGKHRSRIPFSVVFQVPEATTTEDVK
jgi:hypothetical protein